MMISILIMVLIILTGLSMYFMHPVATIIGFVIGMTITIILFMTQSVKIASALQFMLGMRRMMQLKMGLEEVQNSADELLKTYELRKK